LANKGGCEWIQSFDVFFNFGALMNLKPVPILLIIILLFGGCSPNKFMFRNKSQHIILKSYEKIEEIYLEHYVICNNINRLTKNEVAEINEDSVLNIFSAALKKSNIKIIINSKENLCDSTSHFNVPVKLSKIDNDKITSISNPDSTLKLFPVIYINNRSLKHLYFTSNGIPGGGEYLRDTFLTIVIYLIKNNEIIYLKSARYGPVSSETATYDEEPPKKLEQEHWDRLVRLVMSDYIKRLE